MMQKNQWMAEAIEKKNRIGWREKSMYLFDFLRRLFRRSNIPVVIYLVLNVFILAMGIKVALTFIAMSGATTMAIGEMGGTSANAEHPILNTLFSAEYLTCFMGGVLVYMVCLFIALSPIGEWAVRRQTGCKRIRRVDQINFIEPIFREVYDKAMEMDSSLPRNVRLYINDDKSANAFATGRRTICITEGLLYQTPDQIKATLAHEFGHLSHKDTDVILVVRVGNVIINIIVATVSTAIAVFTAITSGFIKLFSTIASAYNGLGALGSILGWLFAAPYIILGWLLNFFIVKCFFGLWTQIGFWLIQLSSRNKEYDADEFSFNCGYGDALCALLASFGNSGSGNTEGLFAALANSHPDSGSRIARLQALGATYYETYGSGDDSMAYQPLYGGAQQQQPGNAVAFSAGGSVRRIPSRNVQPTQSTQQSQPTQQNLEEYTGVVINASKKKQASKQTKYASVPVTDSQTSSTQSQVNANNSNVNSLNVNNSSVSSPKIVATKRNCPVCGLEVENGNADICGFCGTPLNS